MQPSQKKLTLQCHWKTSFYCASKTFESLMNQHVHIWVWFACGEDVGPWGASEPKWSRCGRKAAAESCWKSSTSPKYPLCCSPNAHQTNRTKPNGPSLREGIHCGSVTSVLAAPRAAFRTLAELPHASCECAHVAPGSEGRSFFRQCCRS